MPKYYVQIHPVKVILQANSPKEAALSVLRNHCRGKLPGPYTLVSEKGWDDEHLFSTDLLLGEIHQPSGTV